LKPNAAYAEDGVTETRKHLINLDFYIPPDERFSPTKLAEVLALAVQAVTHFVVPESNALFHGNVNSFRSFDQLKDDLYGRRPPVAVDGQVMDKLKTSVPSHKTYKQVSKMVKETPVKFPIPQVIERTYIHTLHTCRARLSISCLVDYVYHGCTCAYMHADDQEAWRSDEEFAREMLAGLNPVVISRLEVFPPVSRGGKKSSITEAHIESQLQGRTVQKVSQSSNTSMLLAV
jgi:lipoxygenase